MVLQNLIIYLPYAPNFKVKTLSEARPSLWIFHLKM